MREYFYEAVEVGGPEPDPDEEEKARRYRVLMAPDPIEAARQELIAMGVTDFEQQKPVLQHLYLEIEPPGRLERLGEMLVSGEI